MPKPKPIPTDIGEYLSYNPDSGLFTRTKPVSKYKQRTKDKLTGYVSTGYIVLWFRNEGYRAQYVEYVVRTIGGAWRPAPTCYKDLHSV